MVPRSRNHSLKNVQDRWLKVNEIDPDHTDKAWSGFLYFGSSCIMKAGGLKYADDGVK